jgi:hypothetical protein
MSTIRPAAAAATFCLLAASAAAQTTTAQTTTAPAARPAAPAHRWYEAQAISFEGRYRMVETSAGVRSANHLQHKQTVKGAFRFDANGRYTLQATAGSGSSFTGSWENAGPGTGEADAHFGVRYLYVSALPVKGLELQAGGLGFARGEATEITTYDNDGFMMGERVSVKRPDLLFVDEVAISAGYLGDLDAPSVFARADRLDEHNYTQALVGKKLGTRAAVSADWTKADGVTTWRQAVRIGAKETGAIDAIRLELYQRVTGEDAAGFAVTAERALPARVALAAGFANIDRDYGGLNGDRFNRGARVFADAKLPLVRDLSLNVFYSAAVRNDYAVSNRHRFDVVVSYNALKALQRARVL